MAQTATIGLIMSGAFVFNYAVANENVPQLLRNTLVAWNLPPIGFLLCVNLLLFLLAIVIDEITILLVIVPLLVPVAEALHIDLVHFGVVIMLNMMIGLALPPHGLLLFVVSNLTGTSLADIFREVPIFILTMIAMLLLVTFVPDFVLWLPRIAGFAK